MGKRVKSKKPTLEVPNWKKPLPSTFDCLFCNHQKSVLVTLNKKTGKGQLSCNSCDQRFQTGINYLSLPVDVYSDWVDACDAVAKASAKPPGDDDEITSCPDLSAGKGRRSPGRRLEVAVEGEDGDQGDYQKA